MPTLLRTPDGKISRTTLGKLRRATCARCHYLWYASWNCTTGTWSKSLTSYCGYCLPSWAVSLSSWIKLSAGQYGWAYVGGPCICSGECNAPPAEPTAPAVTPPQTRWSTTWQCGTQAWGMYCAGATDDAVSGWTAGICSKTCVVATGTTPTPPPDLTTAESSVCCVEPTPVSGGTWRWNGNRWWWECDATGGYGWEWGCGGIARKGLVCGPLRGWSPDKICNNFAVTVDDVEPGSPPQIPSCIHVWIVNCAGVASDYKLCVTDAQFADLTAGNPGMGLPRGSGNGWVMDPIGCRQITWTLGDTPPAAPGPCPTFVHGWMAVWNCTTPRHWDETYLGDFQRLTQPWTGLAGTPGCTRYLYTTEAGTPLPPPDLTSTESDGCCQQTRAWVATRDCAAATWTIVNNGQRTLPPQGWHDPGLDAPPPPAPPPTPAPCVLICYILFTGVPEYDVPPSPPATVPVECCAPCTCPPGLMDQYSVKVAQDIVTSSGQYMYKTPAGNYTTEVGSNCDWLVPESLFMSVDGGLTWFWGGGALHLKLIGTTPCRWALTESPAAITKTTGSTPAGTYSNSNGVSVS